MTTNTEIEHFILRASGTREVVRPRDGVSYHMRDVLALLGIEVIKVLRVPPMRDGVELIMLMGVENQRLGAARDVRVLNLAASILAEGLVYGDALVVPLNAFPVARR